MFNKWKAKRALCKAFNFYRKKKELYLTTNTISTYEQLEEIEYAIAYVLCEYFNFKCDNPFSYKWYITYDYIHHCNECEEAYEKFVKENNTNHIQAFDLVKPLKGEVTDKQYGIIDDNNGKFNYDYITTLQKGNTYYDIENNKCYMFDGKNLLEMC